MDVNEKRWFEAHRKWMRPDAHLRVRPDAQKWLPAGVAHPALPLPEERKYTSDQPADDAELRAFEMGLLEVKALFSELKLDLELQRLRRKYSPDQPRVPAGNSDGGQWTSGGGQLAGPPPTNDTPEVPQEKPPTAHERNRVARTVAGWVSKYGGPIGKVLAGAYWLYDEYPYIKAYQDPPKSLDELQEAVSTPQKGYDIHHIVERTSAEQDGFPRSQINGRENLVRIPTYKHWEINAWYQAKNEDFGGLSPREYLRGKDWEERRRVGLDALVDHGVLRR